MFCHPASVCMTYYEHFRFSFSLGVMLSMGALKAFIHAFIPDIYITSSSDLSKELTRRLNNSGCKDSNK